MRRNSGAQHGESADGQGTWYYDRKIWFDDQIDQNQCQ